MATNTDKVLVTGTYTTSDTKDLLFTIHRKDGVKVLEVEGFHADFTANTCNKTSMTGDNKSHFNLTEDEYIQQI